MYLYIYILLYYVFIYIYTFVYRICLNTKHMAISRSRQVAQWHHFDLIPCRSILYPWKLAGRKGGTERNAETRKSWWKILRVAPKHREMIAKVVTHGHFPWHFPILYLWCVEQPWEKSRFIKVFFNHQQPLIRFINDLWLMYDGIDGLVGSQFFHWETCILVGSHTFVLETSTRSKMLEIILFEMDTLW